MASSTAERRVQESEDHWPTTMRFSRRLGELYRGADYGRAIEGPYSRFRLFAWSKVSSWLLVAWMILLIAAAGQASYLWMTVASGA